MMMKMMKLSAASDSVSKTQQMTQSSQSDGLQRVMVRLDALSQQVCVCVCVRVCVRVCVCVCVCPPKSATSMPWRAETVHVVFELVLISICARAKSTTPTWIGWRAARRPRRPELILVPPVGAVSFPQGSSLVCCFS